MTPIETCLETMYWLTRRGLDHTGRKKKGVKEGLNEVEEVQKERCDPAEAEIMK